VSISDAHIEKLKLYPTMQKSERFRAKTARGGASQTVFSAFSCLPSLWVRACAYRVWFFSRRWVLGPLKNPYNALQCQCIQQNPCGVVMSRYFYTDVRNSKLEEAAIGKVNLITHTLSVYLSKNYTDRRSAMSTATPDQTCLLPLLDLPENCELSLHCVKFIVRQRQLILLVRVCSFGWPCPCHLSCCRHSNRPMQASERLRQSPTVSDCSVNHLDAVSIRNHEFMVFDLHSCL